jgi:methyltransferase (TIGR00027 family)
MSTKGIDGLLIETHNFGKSVAFWKSLGYELEFETDHHSGRLRHPAGGPYLFIAERPPSQVLKIVPGLSVESASEFEPPTSGTIARPFIKEHWGALQMLLADPDGREVAIEAPVEDAVVGEPEQTAVRTALWRALHVQLDAPPHVIEDEIGLRLVAPAEGWQQRPDMDPQGTRPFRASIVGRARFIEDLLAEQAARGIEQYVLLGAGLDSFAQRRPELASRLRMFEVDRPGPQSWKRRRLVELGFGLPEWLKFVPVDFEAGASWYQSLLAKGFVANTPAVVASTGVSMYLTRDANVETLRQVARLAPGSTFAMTFLLPFERSDAKDRRGLEQSAQGAQASGTPFISFFEPAELLELAREAGFRAASHVSAASIAQRYFADRSDGMRPPNNGEEILLATT